ncbi:MAG: NAD(P)H-dependent oxidoreductase [Candidatus Nealsonbacteria bacterium]
MGKILYIQASPRGEKSSSIAVADAFIDFYKRQKTDDKVEILNVFSDFLPKFDGLAVQAKYTILHGQSHTPEELQAWKKIEKVIAEFKSADKYVLAIPMWNFSIPYRLKQYMDIIIQPGYTFGYSQEKGYEGLVKAKPLLAIYARGGQYPAGTESEAFDMQKKYVETIFKFMGFENIKSIVIEPTLQGGPEVAQQKVQEAIACAKKIASDF